MDPYGDRGPGFRQTWAQIMVALILCVICALFIVVCLGAGVLFLRWVFG